MSTQLVDELKQAAAAVQEISDGITWYAPQNLMDFPPEEARWFSLLPPTAVLALIADLEAAQAALAERDGTCQWVESRDGEYWETSCGEAWCFTDGGVEDNGVKFCHGCGKRVAAVPYVDEPEPDEDDAERTASADAPRFTAYDVNSAEFAELLGQVARHKDTEPPLADEASADGGAA